MGRVAAAVVAGVLAGGFVAGGARTASVAHAGPGAVPPSSVDPTGTTDVTAALGAFFASLPPQTTVQLPAGARYRVEGVLTIENADGLTIDGNGATILATTDGAAATPPVARGARAHWPRLRRHVEFDGGNDIVVRDLVVEGPNAANTYDPKLEGQAAFTFAGVTRAVVDHVTVRHVHGDGVYVTGASAAIDIRSSHFDGIGRQGIAIVSARGVTVRDDELSGIARSAFDIEPLARSVVSHVRLTGNTVGSFVNYLLAEQGGGSAVDDISLDHNDVRAGNGLTVIAGIAKRRRTGLHVVANASRVVARVPADVRHPEPIYVVNVQGVEIRDNTSPVSGGTAIGLDGACAVTITGNSFPGAAAVSRVDAPCGALPVGAPIAPRNASRPRRAPRTAPSSTPSGQVAPAARPARRPPAGSSPDSDAGAWLVAGALALVAAGLGVRRITSPRVGRPDSMAAVPPSPAPPPPRMP